MTAGRQAGGLIGLWLLAGLGATRRKGLLMFATAIGFGVGLMAFSLAGNIYTFLLVLLFTNACAHSVDTLYKTLMQDLVPDEERGRAMGSWVLSIGFAPVGHVGVGALAGAVGAPMALLINGATLTGISVMTMLGLPPHPPHGVNVADTSPLHPISVYLYHISQQPKSNSPPRPGITLCPRPNIVKTTLSNPLISLPKPLKSLPKPLSLLPFCLLTRRQPYLD